MVIYFQLALMIDMVPEGDTKIHWDLINELILPIGLISDKNFSSIYKVEDFIKLKNPCVILNKRHMNREGEFLNTLKEYEEIIGQQECDGVIFYDRFLHNYLLKNYNIKSIYEIEANPQSRLIIFEKKNLHSKAKIFMNPYTRTRILKDLVTENLNSRSDRAMIYSISEYSEILSVKNQWFKGFENLPEYSNSSIISPFMSKRDFLRWFEIIKLENPTKNKDKTAVLLKSKSDKLLPELLINTVIEENYFNSKELTKEKVIEKYIDLITEYIHLIWE